MEKLLFLGNNFHVDEMIKYAKERGVYTIVTDNLPAEKSPVKKLADEAWNISVTDLDALAEKCRQENVTAVLSGASEVCLDANKELCKRLDLPIYIGEEAYRITNDKVMFKKICEECGVPVPESYRLDINFAKEDLDEIVYPVIVKPADGCAGIGFHICNNVQELISGYKEAYAVSKSKTVVVEEYISGDEMNLIYLFEDGTPKCIDSLDYVLEKNASQVRVFGVSPTRYMKMFDEKLKGAVEKLFKRLGCNEGIGFVQFITDGEKSAVLEMNYRLPGSLWISDAIMCNAMLNYVLKEKRVLSDFDSGTDSAYLYSIRLKAGKIAEISGVEKIKEQIPGLVFGQIKQEGNEVEDDSGLRQVFGFALFCGDYENFERSLDIVNSNLVVKSTDGHDMLFRYKCDKHGYAIAY